VTIDWDKSLQIARFWNEDGVEMPGLYQDARGERHCTWDYSYAARAVWLDPPEPVAMQNRMRQLEHELAVLEERYMREAMAHNETAKRLRNLETAVLRNLRGAPGGAGGG